MYYSRREMASVINVTRYNVANSDNVTNFPLNLQDYLTDYILGLLLLCLMPLGVAANATTIYLFTSKSRRHLHTRTTFLLRSLALSDGVMALVGSSMFSISCLNHAWIFGNVGCKFHGMIMFWCGVTSIAHLCVISIERCVTMSNPMWSVANRGKIPLYVGAMVIFCWAFGLFWAVLPLVGVQSYSLEGRVSCSLNWSNRDVNYIAYNTAIFIFVFFIPVVIIICGNLTMYRVVKKSLMMNGSNAMQKQNQKTESQLTRTIILSTIFYLMAWSPYASIAMWASFGNSKAIPPNLITWLAFLAKTSFVFNPIIYMSNNEQYRKEICKLILKRNWLNKCWKDRLRRASTLGSGTDKMNTAQEDLQSPTTLKCKTAAYEYSVSPPDSSNNVEVKQETLSLLNHATLSLSGVHNSKSAVLYTSQQL